jgi:hypothetical protein
MGYAPNRYIRESHDKIDNGPYVVLRHGDQTNQDNTIFRLIISVEYLNIPYESI